MPSLPKRRPVSTALVAIAAIAFAVLAAPTTASAQCVTAVSPMCSMGMCTAVIGALVGPSGRNIRPNANASVILPVYPSALTYIPPGGFQSLVVTKTTMALGPWASWVCTTVGPGGTTFGITINSSHGLPVELMEFSVETEEAPDTDKKSDKEAEG